MNDFEFKKIRHTLFHFRIKPYKVIYNKKKIKRIFFSFNLFDNILCLLKEHANFEIKYKNTIFSTKISNCCISQKLH